jgi:peptidoglycan/LPS O-acetylase OafA/YrhL
LIDFIVRATHLPDYYWHVLINPLPIYGLGTALIALLVAIFMRSRPGQVAALVAVFLAAASAWPAAEFGEAAYDVMYARTDKAGDAWLAQHRDRADDLVFCFYVEAALAAAAIFAPKKWPKSAMPLTIIALLAGILCLGAGGYIAYPAGRVRHTELRTGPPPQLSEHDE